MSVDGLDALKQKKEANKRGTRPVPGSSAPDVLPASTPPPSLRLGPSSTATSSSASPKRVAPAGSPAAIPDGKTGEAPLYRFASRPSNPRYSEEYDTEKDGDLALFAGTVKQVGILQPLTVCPVDVWLEHHPQDRDKFHADVWWIIIIGNRRFASAKSKGLESLSFVRNDRVGEAVQAKKTGLIENHHRKGLNPVLEASEIQDILDADESVTYRELAEEIGFSHGLVWQRLQLLKLIPGLQSLVARRELSADKAWRLAKLTKEQQQQLLDLGAPYSVSRLTEKGESDDVPAGLVTRSAVKIPKQSPPEKVVDALVDGLPDGMLFEVSRLLIAKLQDHPAPA